MIVAGFGMRGATTPDSLRDALNKVAGTDGVAALATLEGKAAALAPLADALNVPLIAISPDAVRAAPVATRSAASLSAHGTGSVAEAAALAAAGPGATLVETRQVSSDRMATCALAERPSL